MIEKYSCAIPSKILRKSWIFKDLREINCVDSNVVVEFVIADQITKQSVARNYHFAFFMLRDRDDSIQQRVEAICCRKMETIRQHRCFGIFCCVCSELVQ